MNASNMIELMNREPFKPLEIRMNDGTSIIVEHPYLISTGRNSPTCIIHEEGEREEDRKLHFVAYRNITEVILEDTSTNGA